MALLPVDQNDAPVIAATSWPRYASPKATRCWSCGSVPHRIPGVQTVRLVPVLIVALVGNDVAEGGQATSSEVVRQLLDRHLSRPIGGITGSREVLDGVVLGHVERINIRRPVAAEWVAGALIARIRHRLQV